MDRLNNNSSYEINYDSFSLTHDDVRNHNDIRSSSRMAPLTRQNNRNTIATFSSQEYDISEIYRMKDRQIAILVKKNELLTTELSAMQQKYPVLQQYSLMEQFSNGNKHLQSQIQFLTKTLNEKFEDLRLTKEDLRLIKKEYALVMQERKNVHRELQDQTAEIDFLKSQNKVLQEQLNSRDTNQMDVSDYHDGACCSRLTEILTENGVLRAEIIGLEDTVQDLTNRNDKSCKQLNSVLDKYYKLKVVITNGINANRNMNSLSGSKFNEEIVSGKVKVIDVKMMLLKIAYDKTGTVGATVIENGCNKSHDEAADTNVVFCLRPDDHILDIEGTCVADWSDLKILDHLIRYEGNSFLKVVVSRSSQICGKFVSWKMKIETSFVTSLSLSPMWMVTKPDSLGQDLPMFQLGDILQLSTDCAVNCSGLTTVNITRLNPQPFLNAESEIGIHSDSRMYSNPRVSKTISIGSSDPISGCISTLNSVFPVLPAKQKLMIFNENHCKSSHQPISENNISQYSNISGSSAPPVPPRSSISLQYSFMENLDLQNLSNMDIEDIENIEFTKEDVFVRNDNDKMNLSVQSAIQFNSHNSMAGNNRDLMSASFSCTSEFSTQKIPKLGKCRKVTLTVPSKMFCLKELGLHLLHGKTEEAPVSKSDVDVSVINQIFIRHVDANSLAHSAGLVEGDEIITINNHSVSKMTAEEAENVFLTNPLKKDRQKYSLLIKAQFNPLKMHELYKEKNLLPIDPSLHSIRFTRSMYDDTYSSRSICDGGLAHRLHVIRSSSNLNVASIEDCETTKFKNNVVHHLQTHQRTVRINFFTHLKLIKIMGGSNMGIFISNIVYKDSDSETKEKQIIGNRLAVGDKILEVNEESFDRMIGDVAVSSLNKLSNQVTMKVIYNPGGLLAINSDPFCQENFYIEATFSFSELYNPLTTFSGKREKSASVCSRLDHLVVNIPFVRGYHLSFEKHDILLVDATILPSNMTKNSQTDNTNSNDWHAWVVDRKNNKIRNGMIPSAFWVEKILSANLKPFKLPFADKNSKVSMRSTPSSPISETNEFLSTPGTSFQNDSSKLYHTNYSNLGRKLFSRMSFRNHSHIRAVSNDETTKGISFQKFRPIKRLSRVIDSKRPVILVGAHSETIAMVLASLRPKEYIMAQSQNELTSSQLHQILTVTKKDVITELHEKNIFPIVLLLNYKSTKQIRQLRICKTSQIKVSKSDGNKLFTQLKEIETHWSHLINGVVFPSHVTDTCEAIMSKVEIVQDEDIWLQVDRYQYSG